MWPPTRSMVLTWGPDCNTCGWRFSTVLASCPPSELAPRSLKGSVFGYAPPVCIASKLLGAGFDPVGRSVWPARPLGRGVIGPAAHTRTGEC